MKLVYTFTLCLEGTANLIWSGLEEQVHNYSDKNQLYNLHINMEKGDNKQEPSRQRAKSRVEQDYR